MILSQLQLNNIANCKYQFWHKYYQKDIIFYIISLFLCQCLQFINKQKMITLYELKNRSICGICLRTPFYIKNLFLLGALIFFLLCVQVVYFSSDGVYLKSIKKVLRGLHSDVFNQLSEEGQRLGLDKFVQRNINQVQLYLREACGTEYRSIHKRVWYIVPKY